MAVIPIRKGESKPAKKTAPATQKAIDELPLNSGDWRVEGVPGLYVRCRAQSRSFFLHRRVRGKLLKETLGALTVKEAKGAAMKAWGEMRPKEHKRTSSVTLKDAIEGYISEKRMLGKMAERTENLMRYNATRYLKRWETRTIEEIGQDRLAVRRLQRELVADHGAATANQVIRLLSAVYRWQRKENPKLPESPTTAVSVANIPARDWALSEDELRAWWEDTKEEDGKLIRRGVKTLGAVKRMWWLAALFTGARKGSIEALRWADVDLTKKVIHFRIAKGDRPYSVPMCDKLAELLAAYRDSGDVPPSDWVFPSNVKDGQHIVGVKNDKEGVPPAHRLRHTYRTSLAQIGASPDQARMLLGHSMGGDVSRGYISAPLVVESLRPVSNAVAEHYLKVLGW